MAFKRSRVRFPPSPFAEIGYEVHWKNVQAIIRLAFFSIRYTEQKGVAGMKKYTMEVEGMMCNMCEAHVQEAVRKALPEASKVKADHKSGTVIFLSEADVDEEALAGAVSATGYTCKGMHAEPYEKKSLFG